MNINTAKQCAAFVFSVTRFNRFHVWFLGIVKDQGTLCVQLGPSLKLIVEFIAVFLEFLSSLRAHHRFLEIWNLAWLLLM